MQSPQARQTDGSDIGGSNGFSCFRSFRGQAAAALQTPLSHNSGWHLLKSTSAIFLPMLYALGLVGINWRLSV